MEQQLRETLGGLSRLQRIARIKNIDNAALLGVHAIQLMTNNPAKVEALEAEGVTVSERVPHQLPPNPHNERYLATKRDRTGHLLDD